jgi:hypothetical protein
VLEDGLAASKRDLERACMEVNSKRDLRLDYLARMRASSSSSKHSINLNRMLQEC